MFSIAALKWLMNKRDLWEQMKKLGMDKFYLEVKQAGFNPGVPELNPPDEGVKIFLKTHTPIDYEYWK